MPSTDEVRAEVDLVNRAGSSMAAMQGPVHDIHEQMAEISGAAEGQSHRLKEIGQAVVRLDQVTQRNFAMFQETAATTGGLSRVADAMQSSTGAPLPSHRRMGADSAPIPRKIA